MKLLPETIAGITESSQQKALFAWAALNVKRHPQLKWLYAIPNGFFSSAAQKAKMKAEGLRNGVPDICLPVPFIKSGSSGVIFSRECLDVYHGLYIELKLAKYRNHAKGGCSDEQLEWIDYLRQAGYRVEVCYGWQEAVKAIEEYLK